MVDHFLGPRASPFEAELANESRLSECFVLPRGLAELLGGAIGIEQIVDDLEGKTQVFRIGDQGGAGRPGRAPQNGAGLAGKLISAPVLSRCR